MQSSRGPPPHGAAPSPTDRSNPHSAVPSSFHTPEPVPSSPHFFTMNPLTDQRLTGPMMPYQPIDHHPLSRYAHYTHPGLVPAVTAENTLSCHIQSQLIHLPRFRTVAVPRTLGPRPRCKCFLRESVLQRLAYPWWHGLAQPRGELICAIITAHKGSAKPQSSPWRYSSVRLVHHHHCRYSLRALGALLTSSMS